MTKREELPRGWAKRLDVDYPAFDGRQACANMDTELWYLNHDTGSTSSTTRMVIELCRSCPFVTPCAEYALAHEVWGVWGGLTHTQRTAIRRQRARHAARLAARSAS